MRFADNRLIYIRRILLAVLVVFTAATQHIGALPEVFSAPAMILVPLVVSIAMFERSMAGLLFGVFAGVLWDFASVRGDGFFGVMLATIGFLSGTLITYFMRNNIYTALILSSGAAVLCNTSYWLLFIARKGYEGAVSVLFSYYLPSALYTIIYIFLYYYIVKYIVQLTTKNNRRNNY